MSYTITVAFDQGEVYQRRLFDLQLALGAARGIRKLTLSHTVQCIVDEAWERHCGANSSGEAPARAAEPMPAKAD